MNILLDTCVILWWMSDFSALSEYERKLIADPDNMIYVSMASLWEISIKRSIGKLHIDKAFYQKVSEDMSILSISIDHLKHLDQLPFHHKDPFDRMLIAQSLANNLKIMTHDQQFNQYAISLVGKKTAVL